MTRMTWRIALILLFAFAGGVIRCLVLPGGIPLLDPDSILGGTASADVLEIELDELLELMDSDDLLLLDARSPEECFEGRIPGAVNLPFMEFEEFFPDLSEYLLDVPILVLYCTGPSCDLAERLAGLLHEKGLDSIRIYPGGVEEWEEAGYPLEY